MSNINIDVNEETLWRFRQAKLKLRVKNNEECLKQMIELVEDAKKPKV